LALPNSVPIGLHTLPEFSAPGGMDREKNVVARYLFETKLGRTFLKTDADGRERREKAQNKQNGS